jgi:hypothetical protein
MLAEEGVSAEGAAAVKAALEAEGLSPEKFRIRHLRQTYFRRGRRAALVLPEGLEVGEAAADEANPGRLALPLAFDLPPGAYATVLVKALVWPFWKGPKGRNRPRPLARPGAGPPAGGDGGDDGDDGEREGDDEGGGEGDAEAFPPG